MLGIVISILVVVVLHLVAYLYLNFWAVVSVKAAITRQDDRIRRRLERAVENDDEDNIEQLVDGLRTGFRDGGLDGAADSVQELRARYPHARLPEEL